MKQGGVEQSTPFCFVRTHRTIPGRVLSSDRPRVLGPPPAASWASWARRVNTKVIDLNADVGEGCGFDAALMPFITSANVAAGYHAGSPAILGETVRLAVRHGVHVGAHPGFRDPENFGRRELLVTPADVETLTREQLRIVSDAARAEGVRMTHVKPHGALYNMAARDRALAGAVVRATMAFDATLMLFAPPRSELFAAAESAGVRVASEVFADRAYNPDGSLLARHLPGAVIDDESAVVARAVRLATEGVVIAADGSMLRLHADTICVHGDTPGCERLAAKLRAALIAPI